MGPKQQQQKNKNKKKKEKEGMNKLCRDQLWTSSQVDFSNQIASLIWH